MLIWRSGMAKIMRLVALLALIPFEPVGATPTNVGSGPKVVNNTDSQAYPDTQDGHRLWVLPPTVGSAEDSTFSMETPAAECDSMNNIIESAKLYSNQIRILAQQRNNLLMRLDGL